MFTKSALKPALLIAGISIAAAPLIAQASVTTGDVVGTEAEAIRTALEAQGYTVHEIEFDDDEIEVEATLDGQAFEIELSVDTGAVLEIEADD